MGSTDNALVDEIYTDTECSTETLQRQTPIRLKELAVCEDAHFAHVEPGMGRQYP